MKSTGQRTRKTSPTVTVTMDTRGLLFNVDLPAAQAQDSEAHEERGEEHHDDDRARVAHVGIGKALQVGIEVRDLGRRAGPAPRHDEDVGKGLDAVDEAEERGHDESGPEERERDMSKGLP